MGLLTELSRRRVYRVAAVYGVTAWVITEVSATVIPALHLPETLITIIVVLLILGFPVALVLAWIFDIEPDGIRRTQSAPQGEAQARRAPARLAYGALLLSATALLGGFFYWRVLGAEDVPRDSIAVLPFVNLSSDASSDYFSDGMAEELLNLLSNVPGLKVAARTSSFAFKGRETDVRVVADQLGVATVLEGSVRWSEDRERVRITAQLIDAESGYHLWSDTYDRRFEDIFAIQDEIATAIVKNLRPQLATGDTKPPAMPQIVPPTADVEAYTLYLRGRALWKKRGTEAIQRSVELFQAALARDPGFARAYSNLAACYVLLPDYSEEADEPREVFYAKASEAALSALTIDETLAEAHAVLAEISRGRWDWSGAETGFYFATSLDPQEPTAHHWYGLHLASVGRLSAALEEARLAAALDPQSGVMQASLGIKLALLGQVEDARAAAERAGALGFTGGLHGLLVDFHLQRGDYDSALVELRQVKDRDSDVLAQVQHLVDFVDGTASEAGTGANAFSAYVARGELDAAYAIADILAQERALPLDRLWMPASTAFRRDARFVGLMKSVGLTDYWRRYGWPDTCRSEGADLTCE
ncbi:MAG: hypothetical protein V3U43_00765 [Pseudomonadales bacterium]